MERRDLLRAMGGLSLGVVLPQDKPECPLYDMANEPGHRCCRLLERYIPVRYPPGFDLVLGRDGVLRERWPFNVWPMVDPLTKESIVLRVVGVRSDGMCLLAFESLRALAVFDRLYRTGTMRFQVFPTNNPDETIGL